MRMIVARIALDLPEFFESNPERMQVLRWLVGEALAYSNDKWGFSGTTGPDDHEASMKAHGFDKDDPASFWFRQVTQYFGRASLMGVDSPQGRQALMKGLMTLFDCCACMIRQHELPPQPGHPSGTLVAWE
jgi:hypothetical protein